MPSSTSRRVRHHRLLQLEAGDAEVQQAADLLVAVEHHRLRCRRAPADRRTTGRPGRRRSPRRACRWRPRCDRSGRQPSASARVDDVLLDRADGHRAEAVVERAAAFAQAVLRAHAAAHFRQRIGFVRTARRLRAMRPSRASSQPVRDVVVQRALPRAVRIAAIEAAPGLVLGLGLAEAAVELAPVAAAGAAPAGSAPASAGASRGRRTRASSVRLQAPSFALTQRSAAGFSAPAIPGSPPSASPARTCRGSRASRRGCAAPRRCRSGATCDSSRSRRCERWFSKPSAAMRRMSISSWL